MDEAFWKRRAKPAEELPLFAPEPAPPASSLTAPKGLTRAGDHETSAVAARATKVKGWVKPRILHLITVGGPMTDPELEALADFRYEKPSSVRCRRKDLYQAGVLVKVAVRGRCFVWGLPRHALERGLPATGLP